MFASAAETLQPLLKSETPVLSIQNGLGGPETAARVLGRERVMVGVVGGVGASMRGAGFRVKLFDDIDQLVWE